ncbi:hypothetical protein [Leifsonia poae]|uniref:hypothetical protein n=1 Tax=Leifsonia poae TaxID=110933 RepID=UPI003D6762EC
MTGALLLPGLMMMRMKTLDQSFGVLLGWLAVAGFFAWFSTRLRGLRWPPLLIAAGAALLGALVGFGVQCGVHGTWISVGIYLLAVTVAIGCGLALLVQLRQMRG